METLIGASRLDSSDGITVVSTIGDPRYFQPYSGWYWQINDGAKTLARSRSMWDQVFTIDKRLIGGRSQFVSQAQTLQDTVKKIVSDQLGKSVDEIKSGSDDISRKIREVSLIIKERMK